MLMSSGFAASYATCGGPCDMRGERDWSASDDGAVGVLNAITWLKRMMVGCDAAGDSGGVEAKVQMLQ